MNPFLWSFSLAVILLLYVVYRATFNILGLKLREKLIPEVSSILHDENASEKSKALAKGMFTQSVALLPFWSLFLVFLLHRRVDIENAVLSGLGERELSAIKTLHMKSTMISIVSNPVYSAIIMLVATPLILVMMFFRGTSRTIDTIINGTWMMEKKHQRHIHTG